MDKIIDILDSIAYEKGLKIDDVENSLKEALIKTAQRMVDTTLIFDANIDRANKKLELFQKIEVVSKDDDRLKEGSLTKEGTPINPENYISLEEAKEIAFIDIIKSIDFAAAQDFDSFYLEIIAFADVKPVKNNEENEE